MFSVPFNELMLVKHFVNEMLHVSSGVMEPIPLANVPSGLLKILAQCGIWS